MSGPVVPTTISASIFATTSAISELRKMMEAISELKPWEHIYNEHSRRTGTAPPFIAEQYTMRKYAGDYQPKYYATATFWNQEYQSDFYNDAREAREELFHKIVAAVLKAELAKEV